MQTADRCDASARHSQAPSFFMQILPDAAIMQEGNFIFFAVCERLVKTRYDILIHEVGIMAK